MSWSSPLNTSNTILMSLSFSSTHSSTVSTAILAASPGGNLNTPVEMQQNAMLSSPTDLAASRHER